MFSYSALLNLDVRDWEFWAREAQKKTLMEKIEKIRMARMAWAEGNDVQAEVDGYREALAQLEGPGKRRQIKKWTELTGRRKG